MRRQSHEKQLDCHAGLVLSDNLVQAVNPSGTPCVAIVVLAANLPGVSRARLSKAVERSGTAGLLSGGARGGGAGGRNLLNEECVPFGKLVF